MLIIHPLLVQSHPSHPLHVKQRVYSGIHFNISVLKTMLILFWRRCVEIYIVQNKWGKKCEEKTRMRTNPQIKTEVANTSSNWIYLSILHVSSTIKINVNANFRFQSLIWSFNLVQSIVFAMRNFLNFICIAVAFILK